MKRILLIFSCLLCLNPLPASKPVSSPTVNNQELFRWIDFVRNRVYGNFVFHDELPVSFEAHIWIRLDMKGAIASTEVVKSSGIPELDRAFLAAIQKSAPFPLPDDTAVLRGGIVLKFIHEPD